MSNNEGSVLTNLWICTTVMEGFHLKLDSDHTNTAGRIGQMKTIDVECGKSYTLLLTPCRPEYLALLKPQPYQLSTLLISPYTFLLLTRTGRGKEVSMEIDRYGRTRVSWRSSPGQSRSSDEEEFCEILMAHLLSRSLA